MKVAYPVVYFLLALQVIPNSLHAQGRTANWIFGDGYHIKYTDGEPEVMPFVPGYVSKEGASCISDTSGELMFYSNTIRVWNRNFQPLYNSDTLPALDSPPSSSKTNGSIFLPWPGDTLDRFFAFLQMNDADNRLYCSKIDRDLDGGLGGIMVDFKNVPVWTHPICEQLTAIKHANGRDWWILARKGYPISTQISLALLTPQGLESYEAQPAGFNGAFSGEMTASVDGSMVAIASNDGNCSPAPPIVALYDFDRCLGILTLKDTLRTRECHIESYGLAFSESGGKLYFSTSDKISLYQISTLDSVLTDSLIFKLSGPLFFIYRSGQLELDINGRINMVFLRPSVSSGFEGLVDHLAVVRDPDQEGVACNLDTFGVSLNERDNSFLSLPNFANYDLGPLVGSPCDTLSPQDTTQTGIPSTQIPALPFSISPTLGSGWFIMEGPRSGWAIVYDLYGREIDREWHEERTTFDLTNQPAGVYLVVLRRDDGNQSLPQKIIRQ